MAFNLTNGEQAQRKLLVTCVNVGTSESAEWEVLGVGVEDSSIEYNPDIETTTDILGTTITKVNKLEMSQDMDPMTVQGGSKLALKLYELVRNQDLAKLMMFEVMVITAFVGDSTDGYDAEVHSGCTITPQSIGGSAYVDMPISINFSNNKTLGTVNKYAGSDIAFTAES